MATFRVYIPQLTKQITDRENTWVFSDPTYPDEYHLTIRREIDLTSTDSLWGLQMVAKSLDEQELSPSIYITKLQLVQGCDVGDEHCLSRSSLGFLPLLPQVTAFLRSLVFILPLLKFSDTSEKLLLFVFC